MSKGKILLCENSHQVGEIRWNGDDVPQIMIYRKAVEPGVEVADEEMLGPVLGQARVPCSICGKTRVWGVSIPVAIYLIESMPNNMLFDFWQELLKRVKTPVKVKHVEVDG